MTAKIPYNFLKTYGPITWRDIEFGLRRNYVSSDVAIDFACSRTADKSVPDSVESAVAASSKDNPLLEAVSKLAAREPSSKDAPSTKWLRIVLAWLYENRETLSDPLGWVEQTYADFDYPQEIASFVRYMPMDGPDLGSIERNEARLIAKWGEFVAQGWRRHT